MTYNPESPSAPTKRSADMARSRSTPADRYRDRNRLLRQHGYARYGDYLKSRHWMTLRAAYRASDLPQHCICGDWNVQLHHLTYERVCNERLSDLTPLCPACHQLVHVLEWRGEIGIDMEGLTDTERAAAGREWLAGYTQRLRAEAEARAQAEREAILALPFAARLNRARQAARARHVNISRSVRLLVFQAKAGKGDESLTRRLRAIEALAYGWDDWH